MKTPEDVIKEMNWTYDSDPARFTMWEKLIKPAMVKYSDEVVKKSDSLHVVRESCDWKKADYGMFGCSDYEYSTSCGKQYDIDRTTKENFCPNCGGKINSL